MPFYPADIPDVMVFEPKVFEDKRGYFFESYNQNTFEQAGIRCRFVQDNQSCSTYGVLRGLHYQLYPYTQAKFVRVLCGNVLDIAVDIRKGSPSYGKWAAVELSGENKREFFIPRGFAHGFVVLSEEAEFFYKCDNYYKPDFERGIIYNDTVLQIDWQIGPEEIIVSEKDKSLPALNEAEINFTYGEKL